jgi:hypothetical protein
MGFTEAARRPGTAEAMSASPEYKDDRVQCIDLEEKRTQQPSGKRTTDELRISLLIVQIEAGNLQS